MARLSGYSSHLSGYKDLVTSYAETRAGFISLALERNRRATPFIEQAKSLKASASQAKKPKDLLKIKNIQEALLTAAGISDKAASHMEEADKKEAIEGLIEKFLEPAGDSFVEELVYRFLLTRGDTLGGSMRNIGGELARRKLARALISELALTKTPFHWLHTESRKWIPGKSEEPDIELGLKGISWMVKKQPRTLIFNNKVPFIKKSVDIVLLNCERDAVDKAFGVAGSYLALGELKGGIDPAGADEHWKTGDTALNRIRSKFSEKRLNPKIFFVGAAIEEAMSKEIWRQLDEGFLQNASNLTNSKQVSSLCKWLCEL